MQRVSCSTCSELEIVHDQMIARIRAAWWAAEFALQAGPERHMHAYIYVVPLSCFILFSRLARGALG